MKRRGGVTLLVVLLLSCLHSATAFNWGSGSSGRANNNNNNKAVLLRDIQVLTFQNGQMTTGQRSRPVAQLSCVGGAARGLTTVDAVQCKNVGFDGVDVQWKCEAQLDDDYRLGTTTVSCEGYAYPDDPYVLAGSCGLEYTLEYTKKGSSSGYGSGYNGGYKTFGSSNSYSNNYNNSNSSSGLGNLLWLGIVGLICWGIWNTVRGSNVRNVGGNYGGGGGGGNGGWFGSSWFGSGPGTNQYYPTVPSAPMMGGGGGGGFWRGLAAGGLMGWLMNGWTRPRFGYNTTYPGSFGFGRRTAYQPGYGVNNGGGFGSSSGGSSYRSSGTHTSTSYGGTKRR